MSMSSIIAKHHKAGNINYPMSTYTVIIHLIAIYSIVIIPQCKASTLMLAYILLPISGMGVTAGAHRLWAHRSYEASLAVRIFLMLCNSIANQGSILHWVKDHRVHHAYSETDKDPHNASRGFFYSHIGWLLLKKDPRVKEAGKKMDFTDIYNDPVVMFQERFNPWLQLFMCFHVPSQLAASLWGEEYWNAFCVAGALRLVVGLHMTFLVNSAAHLYGDHPYDVAVPGRENPIVSFFAFGEGWHNWHHAYPHDYAASEFGVSSQYNPTKVLIDAWAFFGLVWGRKRATKSWELRKVRKCDANGVSDEGAAGPPSKILSSVRFRCMDSEDEKKTD
jgi:stearoyl-CoA desaturase (delta-9 desaturase)